MIHQTIPRSGLMLLCISFTFWIAPAADDCHSFRKVLQRIQKQPALNMRRRLPTVAKGSNQNSGFSARRRLIMEDGCLKPYIEKYTNLKFNNGALTFEGRDVGCFDVDWIDRHPTIELTSVEDAFRRQNVLKKMIIILAKYIRDNAGERVITSDRTAHIALSADHITPTGLPPHLYYQKIVNFRAEEDDDDAYLVRFQKLKQGGRNVWKFNDFGKGARVRVRNKCGTILRKSQKDATKWVVKFDKEINGRCQRTLAAESDMKLLDATFSREQITRANQYCDFNQAKDKSYEGKYGRKSLWTLNNGSQMKMYLPIWTTNEFNLRFEPRLHAWYYGRMHRKECTVRCRMHGKLTGWLAQGLKNLNEGNKYKFKPRWTKECSTCQGSGKAPGILWGKYNTCSICDSTGRVIITFAQGQRVKLRGLKKDPELNGKLGEIVERSGSWKGWKVKLDINDGEVVFKPGMRVTVKSGKFGGQLGKIERFLRRKKEWGVILDSGKKISASVSDLQPLEVIDIQSKNLEPLTV